MSENGYLSIEEQITRLLNEGLTIPDKERAHAYLAATNYTSLFKQYGCFFKKEDGETYRENVSIDEVFSLVAFDRELSSLYLEYILIVEARLRAVISDALGAKYGPVGYLNREIYSDKSFSPQGKEERIKNLFDKIEKTQKEIAARKDDIKSSFSEYTDRPNDIPIWLFVTAMSFGALRELYNCLTIAMKDAICHELATRGNTLETALAYLNSFRNKCAHGERIFDFYHKRKLVVTAADGTNYVYYGTYAITKILKLLLYSTDYLEFINRLRSLLSQLSDNIGQENANMVMKKMRFPIIDIDTTINQIRFDELGKISNNASFLSQDEFKKVLDKYIMPLIPDGKIDCSTKYNSRNTRCQMVDWRDEDREKHSPESEKDGKLQFAQSANEEYCFLTEPVTLSDEQFIQVRQHTETLIHYLQIVWNSTKAKMINKKQWIYLFDKDVEVAFQLSLCEILCKTESPGTGNETERMSTLYCILALFDKWAMKTYEGQHLPFGVVVDTEKSEIASFDYVDFLEQDYSATISDGQFSCILLSADGQYQQHIDTLLSDETKTKFVPYPHQGFSQLCIDGKIGILLTREGDILIIHHGCLQYTKHNGRWTRNQYDRAKKLLENCFSGKDKDECAERVLQTLIDVAYSHGGACLAISDKCPPSVELLKMAYPTLLDEDNRKKVEQSSELTDSEKQRDDQRMQALQQLIRQDRLFYKINAFLRRELIEMDGAIILDSSGKIYSVASIVNTNGAGVFSGARTTAAMRLSKYGIAIKVSQDGYMKFYKNEKEILQI